MVEERTIEFKDVRLERGGVLPQARLVYETHGRLDRDGRNGVLLTHGYTSSHHAADRYAPGKTPPGIAEPGWWDALVGPGKPIDTDRLFAVSSNMLGSSFGSTGPKSIDARTGKPYGPDFPLITLNDIVGLQKRLLDALGAKHLVAVAGPSYGGYQAFQWAVTYPDFMDGIVAVVTAPKGRGGEELVDQLIAELAKDPNWNGGRYYDKGGVTATTTKMRVATLKRYGIDEILRGAFPDPAKRDAEVMRQAEVWAKVFDANAMVALRRAAVKFDAEKDLRNIKAKVLYVLSTTDVLFPPSLAAGVMEKLRLAGVDATYFELKSKKGHLASGTDAALWAPILAAFMQRLMGVRQAAE